jgi:hypothetical protein
MNTGKISLLWKLRKEWPGVVNAFFYSLVTSGCDASTINLSSSVTSVPSGANLSFTVERLGPLFAPLPFRVSEANAGSANAYKAALFEVNATYDGVAAGLGQARIAQGIAMRVAVGAQ